MVHQMFPGTWSHPGTGLGVWDTKVGSRGSGLRAPCLVGRKACSQRLMMHRADSQAQVTSGPEPGKGFEGPRQVTSLCINQTRSKPLLAPTLLSSSQAWGPDRGPFHPNVAKPKRHPSAEEAHITVCPHHLGLDNVCSRGAPKNPANRGPAKLNKL